MLILIPFLFVLVSAQQLPQVFSANLTVNIEGMPALPGNIWFDYPNKAARGDLYGDTFQAVVVPFPQNQTSTFYVVGRGQCSGSQAFPWSFLPAVFALPDFCKPSGPALIDGIQTSSYTCAPTEYTGQISLYLAVAGVPNSFVQANGTVPTGHSPGIPFSISFSNTDTTPIPSSTFTKPAAC